MLGCGAYAEPSDSPADVTLLEPAPPGALPCAVDTILRERCQLCHGRPTAQTAPMSLTTWQDLHAQAPKHRETPAKVYERMLARLHDEQRPMPPRDQPQLSEAELAILDAWLAGGAASGEGCAEPATRARGSAAAEEQRTVEQPATPAESTPPEPRQRETSPQPSAADVPATEPRKLPTPPAAMPAAVQPKAEAPEEGLMPSDCEYVELRARQDAAGAPFQVPADATDLYQCFLFDLNLTKPTQGLAFEHLSDNPSVVHHWMLRTLEQTDKTGPLLSCDDPTLDTQVVAGWAPGSSDWHLPKDVGMDLGRGLMILEVHYNNIGKPATTDRSGVRVCTTRTLRPHTAGVSWLGSQLFFIPPKSKDFEVAGRCKPSRQSEPIQILKVWPHMHLRGKRSTLRLDRANGMQQVVLDEPFSFESQKSYDVPISLMPGDSLVSSCYFDNPSNTVVTVGNSTMDEMCNQFVIAYPAGQLRSDGFGLEHNSCLGIP